jgi:hypothetical protein
MKWSGIIALLLGVTCFVTNPKQRDFQFKANELFEQALNSEADSGSTIAKVARFFGAGKRGDLIFRVERKDYFLFSTANVYSTLENEQVGLLLGVLGQVYLIQ